MRGRGELLLLPARNGEPGMVTWNDYLEWLPGMENRRRNTSCLIAFETHTESVVAIDDLNNINRFDDKDDNIVEMIMWILIYD